MLKTYLYTLFIALCSLLPVTVSGQNSVSDTIPVIKNEDGFYENDPEPSPADSSLMDPNEDYSDKFFNNLEEQSEKKRWLRELHNTIVIPPSRPSASDSLVTSIGASRFIEFEGLIIHEIRLVKLNPFNVSIRDTVPKAGNFFTRTANNLHIKTHDRILERQVLLRSGERINPQKLADNERLLRELPFIEDAVIMVERLEDEPDAANIIILTKDLWSKAFFIQLNDINSGKLEIFDKNLFGLGIELQNNIHWDPLRENKMGYEAIYRNPNVFGSFINSRLHFTDVFETKSYGYSFQRKFYTHNIKYAGGSTAYYLNTNVNIWVPDSGYREDQMSTHYFDLWAGRSIRLKKEFLLSPGNLNLVFATRVIKESFDKRPEAGINSYYRYHNKVLWLSSLALSNQNYFKSNYIYSFGRTEDIPTGFLANLTFGPEFGEFSRRFYSSISLSSGNYVDGAGYFYTKTAFGGFHTREGIFEQGLLDLNASWFTNLFIMGGFKFRHFLKFNYTKGYNRFMDEKVFINDPYGIRGFSERNVFGDQKFVFSYESDVFLPLNFIGFQFVGFGFADVAILGDQNTSILSKELFTGLGLGFRIRNERLAFPTFTIRFAYYPNLPEMSPADFIRFMGEERFRPDNFNVEAPSLVDFR